MFDFSFNQTIFIAVAILLMVVLFFLVYYFTPKQIILRKLSKLRLKPVVSLKDNELVKVVGKALPVKQPLQAPFTKRKCVYYAVKIQKKVSSGKSSHWKTIVNHESIIDFFIEQNGSLALVKPTQEPKNYLSYLVIDTKQSIGMFKKATPEFLELLDTYNIKSKNIFGLTKQLKYAEAVVEVGEKITVGGTALWENLTESFEGYHYSKIATLQSAPKQKLIITDIPKAQRAILS